jgi:hypothetical protein
VAFCLNRATCCFDASQSRSCTAESRFRRASWAENEHKGQPDLTTATAHHSIFASDPPRAGTDLRTALKEAVENYEAGITINEDLLTMLREFAAETGESVNSQVNKAVRDYVEVWSDPEPAPSLVVQS